MDVESVEGGHSAAGSGGARARHGGALPRRANVAANRRSRQRQGQRRLFARRGVNELKGIRGQGAGGCSAALMSGDLQLRSDPLRGSARRGVPRDARSNIIPLTPSPSPAIYCFIEYGAPEQGGFHRTSAGGVRRSPGGSPAWLRGRRFLVVPTASAHLQAAPTASRPSGLPIDPQEGVHLCGRVDRGPFGWSPCACRSSGGPPLRMPFV